MTDCATPHAGIELDVINLSKDNKQSLFKSNLNSNNSKINYQAFIKYILKKMLDNTSFLSFSTQIKNVNQILKMKYSSANDIANVILKDVALTTKLLKLVNSSFYGQFSNKGITSISEAMIILGTQEIKLAAASLKIYDFMQNIATIKILKVKTLRSLQRSIIARQIALDEEIKDAEAIQISAMLYDFGEYLVALFSPEVFITIELLLDENRLTRDQASKSIIGISYGMLGRFMASKWNLPESIIHAMKPVENINCSKNDMTIEEFKRTICAFSNELCNIDFSMGDDHIRKKIMEISTNYESCLEIPASKSVELLKMSRHKITQHSSILKTSTKKI
ncbi:HDOD domain-containing protein [Desulfobacula phenolica]|uniref:HD-like signal output (HDOD) domain, no enzymatic activity n=1 Tax=Desulfobacula phenolica TaxID=90732 RepID=A0A1H2GB33_9BACT|nr:HDOD domain-containing protein [Desulfobacula phenolica]SDU16750.1 HD-like signal output (HDOD) domain, no enzymatic activity [Desulfobacula phenolica]